MEEEDQQKKTTTSIHQHRRRLFGIESSAVGSWSRLLGGGRTDDLRIRKTVLTTKSLANIRKGRSLQRAAAINDDVVIVDSRRTRKLRGIMTTEACYWNSWTP
jgi:hypothetical protein